MNQMHLCANETPKKPEKSAIRRLAYVRPGGGRPPRPVEPEMDPENEEEVERRRFHADKEVLQATLKAYLKREAEETDVAQASDRHIVFKEERGRFFELGSNTNAFVSLDDDVEMLDLSGSATNAFILLDYVAEVKPEVNTCDSLAAEVLDLSFEDVYEWGYRSAKFNLGGRMDVYVDRCFRVIGAPVSIEWIKAALHDSMITQLHDLIERAESRLKHLESVPLPQFSVRTKNKERENADPKSWTPERNAKFCEDVFSRVPDALVQRFMLRRVAVERVVGLDAKPKVLLSLIRLRDYVLCPAAVVVK